MSPKSNLNKSLGWFTYRIRDKRAGILQTTFFKRIFLGCSQWAKQQNASIGSDTGLERNRQQAIIWTSDGIAYLRINASLDRNNLANGRIFESSM